MKAPIKLGLFAMGLAALFAASFAVAGAVIPADASAAWKEQTEGSQMDHDTEGDTKNEARGHTETHKTTLPGLSVDQDGYQIGDVSAPPTPDVDGILSFRLTGPGGAGVTDYETSHDKDLHLIVVRSDGTQFRHVHPSNAGDGVWSLPWKWDAAGTYRIFADFVPAGGDGVTLTSTVSVGGTLASVPTPEDNLVATTGEFTVELGGALLAGSPTELSLTVKRGGEPVTALEPYLGASGHLVVLREGDLGYLHAHAMGESDAGPLGFMVETPTAGKYFLYLDFKVDGEVHTAEFVATATGAPTS